MGTPALNTFFHVDIANRLQTGMSIELGPDRPSIFGLNYLQKFKSVGIAAVPPLKDVPAIANVLDDSAYREFYLEVVRTDHPEIKNLSTVSRLNAFFAVESLEDAHRYIARSQFHGKANIYEVHSSGPSMKLDMTWLDQKFPRDIRKFGYYYEKYWRGLRIEDDPHLGKHEKRGSLIEVLLASPVTIGSMTTQSGTL